MSMFCKYNLASLSLEKSIQFFFSSDSTFLLCYFCLYSLEEIKFLIWGFPFTSMSMSLQVQFRQFLTRKINTVFFLSLCPCLHECNLASLSLAKSIQIFFLPIRPFCYAISVYIVQKRFCSSFEVFLSHLLPRLCECNFTLRSVYLHSKEICDIYE